MGLGMSPVPASPPAPTDAFLFLWLISWSGTWSCGTRPTTHSISSRGPQRVRSTPADILSWLMPMMLIWMYSGCGGKLLLLHGTVDMAIAPENTVAYYDRLVKRYGRDACGRLRDLHGAGFGHGDGAFQMRWDGLTAIDQWADAGKEPLDQVATDAAAPTAGRSRPLCEYPAWARYVGSGDANAAGSFRCTDR